MGFLISYFLGPSFQGSGLQLVRARAFISVCSLVISVLTLNIISLFFIQSGEQVFKLALLVNLSLILIYFSSLMTIRFTGQLSLSVNFVVFWTNLALTLLCFLDGGAVESNITWLCWVPLLMAFVFGGPKTGCAWAAALLLYYGISAYLEFHNYNFPQALPTDTQFTSTLSTWISGTAIFIALTFYIDNMMLNLSRMRGGSFTLLHKYLADNGEKTPVYYELIENHIYQTGLRHKLFKDKYALIVIAIQIESNDEIVQQAIREESFQRIQRLLRRIDLAVQMDNGYFAIVLENISTIESAENIINGITRIFYQPYNAGGGKVRVTPFLKTHIFPDEGTDAEAITANLRRRIKH